MNIMGEIAVVFGVCLISEGISFLLPFPFPAGVISLVLLLLLLFSGVVKERHIGPGLRLPGGQYGLLLRPALCSHHGALGEASSLPAPLPFYCRSHHPLVYLVTAWTIQLLIRRKGGKGR